MKKYRKLSYNFDYKISKNKILQIARLQFQCSCCERKGQKQTKELDTTEKTKQKKVVKVYVQDLSFFGGKKTPKIINSIKP